jgi:hypothetical protein
MDDKDTFILTGSGTDSITVTDTVTMNLDFGAAMPALTASDIQTISLDDIVSTSTISLPSTYTISLPGAQGTSSYNSSGTYITTGTGGYTWNQSYSPTVNIDNDGVNIKAGGDLKIGDMSLKDFMQKMEQRLAILVPDPEKLEKFEALKKAYEHYKTMESLCFPEEKDHQK